MPKLKVLRKTAAVPKVLFFPITVGLNCLYNDWSLCQVAPLLPLKVKSHFNSVAGYLEHVLSNINTLSAQKSEKFMSTNGKLLSCNIIFDNNGLDVVDFTCLI